jgi:hypothetical protein
VATRNKTDFCGHVAPAPSLPADSLMSGDIPRGQAEYCRSQSPP